MFANFWSTTSGIRPPSIRFGPNRPIWAESVPNLSSLSNTAATVGQLWGNSVACVGQLRSSPESLRSDSDAIPRSASDGQLGEASFRGRSGGLSEQRVDVRSEGSEMAGRGSDLGEHSGASEADLREAAEAPSLSAAGASGTVRENSARLGHQPSSKGTCL